jgi:hypothetical protein
MIENIPFVFLLKTMGSLSGTWINQFYSYLPSKAVISATFFTNSCSILALGNEKQQSSMCGLVRILL